MKTVASILVFMGFRGVFLFFACMVVLSLSLQNMEPIGFKFLFWTFAEVSKMYLILGCVVIGVFMGAVLGFMLGRWRGLKVAQKDSLQGAKPSGT